MTGLSWTSFRLPLRAPFRTAWGCVDYREGMVLRLTADAGVAGLGEASPHPALGPGAVREVEEALAELAPQLLGAEIEALEPPGPGSLPAAAACALDTAVLDAMARARGVPLAHLLAPQAASSVPVNATIAAGDAEEAATEAAAARRAGFRCVKLKVGVAPGLEGERRRVAAVRQALGPDVALRLDANGAWTERQAVEAIRSLAEFGPELAEQPLPAGDPKGMARVRASVEVPIAADEDVTGPDAADRLLAAGAADALVVKPMVVGGLRPALAVADAARRARASVIVTTTIDAGVGVAAALHLAAALSGEGQAHGLATGLLLGGDVVRSPVAVEGGRMAPPAGPGLGVQLDEGALARYAVRSPEVRR